MGMQTDRNRYTGALADINVTPLVDVVLVLLIVFMIAAPVVLQGLQTDLPKAIVSDLEIDANQVVVTLTLEKNLYIDNDPVDGREFIEALQRRAAERDLNFVYLRADRSLKYGEVVDVVQLIKQAGIPNLGIVTEYGVNEEQ
jgi:biopolymer transport protein TolR